ncbi:hypothetical protein Tco_0459566 [Tanacetum coccineum]
MLDQGEAWEIEAVEEPNRECDKDLSSFVKLKEHWCKAILQQKGDGHEFWASCDPYDDQCDGGDFPNNTKKKIYWCCLNDDKRLDVAWEGMSFKDWVRESQEKVRKMTEERILKDYWRQELIENHEDMIDISPNIDLAQETNMNTQEDYEYLKNFGEEKIELILDTVLDKLDDGWFSGTANDEDNLDGITDYLELKSHDAFIDVYDEAYKE